MKARREGVVTSMASDWNTKVIEEFRANGGKVEGMGTPRC